jgi:hypothetical protein
VRLLHESRRFRIEYSARAWSKIGSLPGDVFREIRDRLADIAEVEAVTGGHGPTPGSCLALRVGEYVALYSCFDRTNRTLILEDVARRLPRPG